MSEFKPRNIRMQILVNEETKAKLTAVSEMKNESQNEIINKSLSAYLARFNKALEKASNV